MMKDDGSRLRPFEAVALLGAAQLHIICQLHKVLYPDS